MVKIFRRRALKGDYALGPGFAERLATVIAALDRDRTFANGRTVRRLFHRVRACQERRLLNTPEPTTDDLRYLLAEDIPTQPATATFTPSLGHL